MRKMTGGTVNGYQNFHFAISEYYLILLFEWISITSETQLERPEIFNAVATMNFEEKNKLYPESGPGKPCPVTTPLEKTLLFIIALVVIIGIGLSIAIANLNSDYDSSLKRLKKSIKNETNICFTSTCISEASNLMKSIDPSVDPCTDFYSFACGNWMKNAHLTTTLESQFTRLTKIISLRTKEILENLGKETDIPEHKRKAADFYKACMNKANRNKLGAEELLSDLEEFGGWPLIEDEWDPSTFDWAELMVNLHKQGYISNYLFDVDVNTDPKNTSKTLIRITQPSLGLSKKMFYFFPYEEMIESYKNVLFELAKLLKNNLSKDKSMEAINDSFKIEDQLAHAMKDDHLQHPSEFYNFMTLKELQKFATEIPWRKILRNLLPNDTELDDGERIQISTPSMIKSLNDILKVSHNDDGKRALANYMFYRTVFHASEHLSSKYYQLVKKVFEAVTAMPCQLWETCVKTTMHAFPHSLTASYADKYMDAQTKDLLDMMIKDMKNALEDGIQQSDWLDEKTRKYALLKVEKMKKIIAYEDEIMNATMLNDFYENINISNNHFRNVKEVQLHQLRRSMEGLHDRQSISRWSEIKNLLTANAYYHPNLNYIVVPIGILQDPVFAPNRPNYINYGSLGMVVGHELTHAFDSIGGLYDAEGSYRMWWSPNSWNKFLERKKCFEEQYDNYYVAVVETNVNGTQTITENIADNGGLKTAYHAYNKLLKRIGSEKSLPGLPYNERQMFWIAFASVWCKKQTHDSLESGIKHNVHTPSQFRVIGSLSNMKEFSDDFKCKFNSTMNPKTRCSLW